MTRKGLLRSRFLLFSVIALGGLERVHSQGQPERFVNAVAAASSGSFLVVALNDVGANGSPTVFGISPSGNLLWKGDGTWDVKSIAISSDNKLIALGLDRNATSDVVAQIVDATGKPTLAILQDEAYGFVPNKVNALAFSPDRLTLYGLTEDGLFAWSLPEKKLLWTRPVPGGPPSTQRDTATSFALSPDGNRLGLNRFGQVYLVPTAPAKTGRPAALPGDINNVGDQPAFSSDGRYFVTGFGYNSSFAASAAHYPRGGMLWKLDGSKPVPVKDCGGYFAWTYNPEVFACQNYMGTHLRSVRDPGKDVGTAGPVSDIPFVKAGDSVWAAAYKVTDWKDPARALPLTLVELGTGKRITVTVPGRSAAK